MLANVPPPPVCPAFFGSGAVVTHPMASAGFSGSRLLLVDGPAVLRSGDLQDRWVLKTFSRSTTIDSALWTHAFMRHLRSSGLACVPDLRSVVERNGTAGARADLRVVGETLVEDADGAVWEAVRYLPGHTVHSPTPGQAESGMRTLATVHTAAASFAAAPIRLGHSRGLDTRIERARSLLVRPLRRRMEAASPHDRVSEPMREAFDRAGALLERHAAVLERLAETPSFAMPLQAVLRDVWSDHLLFDGERVSGLVDFHAAGVDTVATDLARLLGSWRLPTRTLPRALHGFGEVTWREWIDAYAAVRPLSRVESALVPMLHHAGVIVGIDHWFCWLVEQGRIFADGNAVSERITGLVESLPAALATLPDAIESVLKEATV